MAYPVYEGNGGIAAAQDDYVDVPYPSTVNENDILVAVVGDADNDTFDVPSGWEKVDHYTHQSDFSAAHYWKRATGSETGTERFTSLLTAGLVVAGVMLRFSGCITTGNPFDDEDLIVKFIGSTGASGIHLNTTSAYEGGNEWVASESISVDSVTALLYKVGSPTGNLTVKIYDESGGEPNAVITNGTSASIDVSTFPAKGQEFHFTFSTPPSLTGSSTYFFILESDSSVDASNYVMAMEAAEDGTFDKWKHQQGGTWTEDTTQSKYMKINTGDVHPGQAGVTQSTTATISGIETGGAERLCVSLIAIEDNLGTSDDATNYSEVMDVTTATGSDMGFSAFTYQKATAGSVAADSCTVGGSDYWASFTFALKPVEGGSAVNLTATIAAATTTGSASLAVTRPLTATVAAATTTAAAGLDVARPLTAAIAAATTTGAATLDAGRALTATVAAVTATGTPSLAVTRPLTATVAADTTTGAANLGLARALTATIAAETSTGTPTLDNLLALTATVAAGTSTGTPSLAVTRPLTATIAAATETGTPSLATSRPLTATVAAETSTGAASLGVARPLTATVAAVTTTSAATLDTGMALTATIAAVTSTSTPSLAIDRPLTATVAAETSTGAATLDTSLALTATIAAETSTGTPSLAVTRPLTATVAAVTVTGEVDLSTDTQLSASIDAVTTTGAASLAVDRPLTATIAAATTTGTPSLGLTRALTATIAASTSTGAASLVIDRPLTATIAAETVTGAATLGTGLDLTATIAAVTTTGTASAVIDRALTATSAAVTSTSTPSLAVVRALTATNAAETSTGAASLAVLRPLTATIAAATTMGTPTLDVDALGVIIDPSFVSLTLLRTFDSSTPIRAPTSLTVRRTIHSK